LDRTSRARLVESGTFTFALVRPAARDGGEEAGKSHHEAESGFALHPAEKHPVTEAPLRIFPPPWRIPNQ